MWRVITATRSLRTPCLRNGGEPLSSALHTATAHPKLVSCCSQCTRSMRCRRSRESWCCSWPRRTCPGCRQSAFVAFLLPAPSLQQSLSPPHLLRAVAAIATTAATSHADHHHHQTNQLHQYTTQAHGAPWTFSHTFFFFFFFFSVKVAQRDESNGAFARMARSAVRLSLTCLTCLSRA